MDENAINPRHIYPVRRQFGTGRRVTRWHVPAIKVGSVPHGTGYFGGKPVVGALVDLYFEDKGWNRSYPVIVTAIIDGHYVKCHYL